MTVKNKKWYIASRFFGFVAGVMFFWLLADAWILGDIGPDKIWYLEAAIAAAVAGICLFAEKKAGITYASDDEEDEKFEDNEAPEFLRRMM